jgi:hypothetical protein
MPCEIALPRILELYPGNAWRVDLPFLGAGVIDRRLQCRAISLDSRWSQAAATRGPKDAPAFVNVRKRKVAEVFVEYADAMDIARVQAFGTV